MQDTSIKGNGTSRFIKGASNFPTSFEEFRRQIVAGTLTADIGLNPAGCDVVGTALSKANLLTDEVANKIGLAETKNVNEALNKLFTFASNGKALCANAVTGKGVQTSLTATFQTIADNIKKIETGADTSNVSATEADVRDTVQFVRKDGALVYGSMGTFSMNEIAPKAYDQSIQGHRYMDMDYLIIKGDPDLSPKNVVDGVNIFGVVGDAPKVKILTVFDPPTFIDGGQRLHITFSDPIVKGEYLSGFVYFTDKDRSCAIMFENCEIKDGLASLTINVKIGYEGYTGYTLSFYTSGYMEIDISSSDLGFTPKNVKAYLVESEREY